MKIDNPFFKILLLIFALLSIFIIKEFITLLITAVIISYIIKPIYKGIKKIFRNKHASAITAEFIFFVAIISIILFSINSIYYQISNFGSSLFSQYINIDEYLVLFNDSSILIDFNDDLTSQLFNIFTTKSIDFALKTPLIIIEALILIFATYYFLLHSGEIYESLFRIIPENSRNHVLKFFSKISDLIKELSFGYFLISIFVILFSFIFFNFIKFSMAMDYAILSGVFSLIPMIGNWAIPIFLSIYYFYSKNYANIIIILLFSFFLDYLIKMIRRITNKTKTIHPLLFIFGVIIGFYSFGILGFIIGPVLFGIIQLGFQEVIRV